MVVGVLELDLGFPGHRSLKSKRQVLRSLKDRIAHKFNVSVAEVDGQDLWQRGSLGVACVSTDPRHAEQMLRKVVDFVESAGAGRCNLLHFTIEMV